MVSEVSFTPFESTPPHTHKFTKVSSQVCTLFCDVVSLALSLFAAEFGEMQSGVEVSAEGGAREELSDEVAQFVDQVIKNALIGYEMELAAQGHGRVRT